MRVLVTGGTGYLGRAIVRALIARGHDPVVFARRATNAGLTTRAIDGDVRDRPALVSAARGCDALCHSAALVSIWRRDAREFHDVNVAGLETRSRRRTMRACHASSTPRRSSRARRPDAAILRANPYQHTKAAADTVARAARDAGRPIIVLYPGVSTGPGVMTEGNIIGRLFADHLAGRLPGLDGPEHVWSLCLGRRRRGGARRGDRACEARVRVLAWRRQPAAAAAVRDPPRPPGREAPRRIPYWLAVCAGIAEEARARLTGRSLLLTRYRRHFRHDWPVESAEAARDLGLNVTPVADGVRTLLETNRST